MRWRLKGAGICLVGLLLSGLAISAADPVRLSRHVTPPSRSVSWRWNLQQDAKVFGFRTVGVDAVRAWTVTRCSRRVAVAIVDSGIKAGTPDLRGRVEPGVSFMPGESPGLDETGHGTAVALVAAGSMNPHMGVAGICPNASVIPVKVMGVPGTGSGHSVASGIRWAAGHRARVINVSLGIPDNLDVLNSAVQFAIQQGVVVVADTGNSGTDAPFYPVDDPGVLAVGGSDRGGGWWNQSGYGAHQLVLAPADNILIPEKTSGDGPEYAWAGTSFAAAQVSGLAAMLLSLHPRMSRRAVIHLIEAGARPVPNSAGMRREVGWGIIDCYRTLQLAAKTQGLG